MSRVCYSQVVFTDCGPAIRYLIEEVVGNIPKYRVGILFLNPRPAPIRPLPLHADPFNAHPHEFENQVNSLIFEEANVDPIPEETSVAQQVSVIVRNPYYRNN